MGSAAFLLGHGKKSFPLPTNPSCLARMFLTGHSDHSVDLVSLVSHIFKIEIYCRLPTLFFSMSSSGNEYFIATLEEGSLGNSF